MHTPQPFKYTLSSCVVLVLLLYFIESSTSQRECSMTRTFYLNSNVPLCNGTVKALSLQLFFTNTTETVCFRVDSVTGDITSECVASANVSDCTCVSNATLLRYYVVLCDGEQVPRFANRIVETLQCVDVYFNMSTYINRIPRPPRMISRDELTNGSVVVSVYEDKISGYTNIYINSSRRIGTDPKLHIVLNVLKRDSATNCVSTILNEVGYDNHTYFYAFDPLLVCRVTLLLFENDGILEIFESNVDDLIKLLSRRRVDHMSLPSTSASLSYTWWWNLAFFVGPIILIFVLFFGLFPLCELCYRRYPNKLEKKFEMKKIGPGMYERRIDDQSNQPQVITYSTAYCVLFLVLGTSFLISSSSSFPVVDGCTSIVKSISNIRECIQKSESSFTCLVRPTFEAQLFGIGSCTEVQLYYNNTIIGSVVISYDSVDIVGRLTPMYYTQGWYQSNVAAVTCYLERASRITDGYSCTAVPRYDFDGTSPVTDENACRAWYLNTDCNGNGGTSTPKPPEWGRRSFEGCTWGTTGYLTSPKVNNPSNNYEWFQMEPNPCGMFPSDNGYQMGHTTCKEFSAAGGVGIQGCSLVNYPKTIWGRESYKPGDGKFSVSRPSLWRYDSRISVKLNIENNGTAVLPPNMALASSLSEILTYDNIVGENDWFTAVLSGQDFTQPNPFEWSAATPTQQYHPALILSENGATVVVVDQVQGQSNLPVPTVFGNLQCEDPQYMTDRFDGRKCAFPPSADPTGVDIGIPFGWWNLSYPARPNPHRETFTQGLFRTFAPSVKIGIYNWTYEQGQYWNWATSPGLVRAKYPSRSASVLVSFKRDVSFTVIRQLVCPEITIEPPGVAVGEFGNAFAFGSVTIGYISSCYSGSCRVYLETSSGSTPPPYILSPNSTSLYLDSTRRIRQIEFTSSVQTVNFTLVVACDPAQYARVQVIGNLTFDINFPVILGQGPFISVGGETNGFGNFLGNLFGGGSGGSTCAFGLPLSGIFCTIVTAVIGVAISILAIVVIVFIVKCAIQNGCFACNCRSRNQYQRVTTDDKPQKTPASQQQQPTMFGVAKKLSGYERYQQTRAEKQ